MINKTILKTILNSHSIEKCIYIQEENFDSFIICSMKDNLSFSRWNHLEVILSDYTKKEVALLPLSQAEKLFKKDYFKKGVVIEWKTIKLF